MATASGRLAATVPLGAGGSNGPQQQLTTHDLAVRAGLTPAQEAAVQQATGDRLEAAVRAEVDQRLGAIDYREARDRLWAVMRAAAQSQPKTTATSAA